MYRSISSLEARHLRTPYCKAILVDPRSASEAQFVQLKLNVYPLEWAKLYMCGSGFWGRVTGRTGGSISMLTDLVVDCSFAFRVSSDCLANLGADQDEQHLILDDPSPNHKKAEPRRSTSEERHRLGVIIDPNCPTGEVQAGKGYMKEPATFMIEDNLFVSPSPITSMALLNQLNVPINDVVERVVTIGIDESDVFNLREPYPEVMLKV
ncbi:hypothetical protein Acr_28g0005250 [Actinidia rufa]|uniref:Uncharacterized protein n=1 Tax=Actinidia rufa TaxID=165716 RepID=A0A7J0H9M2_9ERIC|nr:hypothetical protein Acr_28g0005250 [Actinidia rufa]